MNDYQRILRYYEAEIKACKHQIGAMEEVLKDVEKLESYKFTKHMTNRINENLKLHEVRVVIYDQWSTRGLKFICIDNCVDYDGRAYYSEYYRETTVYLSAKYESDDKEIEPGGIRTPLLETIKRFKKDLAILERNADFDIIKSKEAKKEEVMEDIRRFNDSLDCVSKRFYYIP